jgi:RNA polymerase sigma-70 factor, ECF subfamily
MSIITPVSLLDRLKHSGADDAWSRFVELYTPLILVWAKKLGVPPTDVNDFVQDIFTTLVREMPRFRYQTGGRFRGWLWTLVLNKRREGVRRASARPVLVQDDGISDVEKEGSDIVPLDEAEYRQYVVERALQLMKSEFETTTWQACWETTVNGRTPMEVAEELGISVNSVHIARSRVLRRLRSELIGLLD